MSGFRIRTATPADASAIHDIYDYYVKGSICTFWTTAPSVEQLRENMTHRLLDYPSIVARVDDQVVGFAQAERFRLQQAYDWVVEESIFIADDSRGRGIGTALLTCLCDILAYQGFFKAYACLAVPNESSEALHAALGFENVCSFPKIGYKFGDWHDIHWLEKVLGPIDEPLVKPTSFSALDQMNVERIFELHSRQS